MADLTVLATHHGDQLQSMGLALEALGNLLGADGSEHNLNSRDLDGLAHAVRALGGYAFAAGVELYAATESTAHSSASAEVSQ